MELQVLNVKYCLGLRNSKICMKPLVRKSERRRRRCQCRRPLAASDDNKSYFLCAVENAERGCHVSENLNWPFSLGGKKATLIVFQGKIVKISS